MHKPIEPQFNACVQTMFKVVCGNLDYTIMGHDGYPEWESVESYVSQHRRIPVYEVPDYNGAEYGIIANEEVFYELAAWIAWTAAKRRSSDPLIVFSSMAGDVIDRYGYDKTVARWLAYLHAYVIGLTAFQHSRKRYPVDAYGLIVEIVDKGLDYALANYEADDIAA